MKTKKALAVLLAVVILAMPFAVVSYAASEIIAQPIKTVYTDCEKFNPQGLVISVDGEEIPRTQDEIDEIMKKCQFGSIWGQGGIRMKNVNLAEETAGEKMTAAGYKKFLARLEKNLRIPFLVGMDCENGATLVADTPKELLTRIEKLQSERI